MREVQVMCRLWVCLTIIPSFSANMPDPLNYKHYQFKRGYVHVIQLSASEWKPNIVAELKGLNMITRFKNKQQWSINGSFFGHSKQGMRPVGALKINRIWVNQIASNRGIIGWQQNHKDIKWYFDRPQLTKQGWCSSYHTDRWWEKADDVIAGAPLLVYNYKAVDVSSENLRHSFIHKRYARSMLCLLSNGAIKLFIVNGSDGLLHTLRLYKKGVNIKELTQIALNENCMHAINLDGGYSSMLVGQHRIIRGVPFRWLPSRKVANAITFNKAL